MASQRQRDLLKQLADADTVHTRMKSILEDKFREFMADAEAAGHGESPKLLQAYRGLVEQASGNPEAMTVLSTAMLGAVADAIADFIIENNRRLIRLLDPGRQR